MTYTEFYHMETLCNYHTANIVVNSFPEERIVTKPLCTTVKSWDLGEEKKKHLIDQPIKKQS